MISWSAVKLPRLLVPSKNNKMYQEWAQDQIYISSSLDIKAILVSSLNVSSKSSLSLKKRYINLFFSMT